MVRIWAQVSSSDRTHCDENPCEENIAGPGITADWNDMEHN